VRYAQLVILVLAAIVGTSFLGFAQERDRDRVCQRDNEPNRDTQSNSDAYQKGVQIGRSDAQHNRRPNPPSEKGQSDVDRRDYERGYRHGYSDTSNIKVIAGRQEYGIGGDGGHTLHKHSLGSVGIQQNNSIVWQSNGTANACVYFQVDNGPESIFAVSPSGTQGAPWISQGHQYVFILRDISGAELAKDQIDLRSPSASNRLGSP
jgi:hypothetical protein